MKGCCTFIGQCQYSGSAGEKHFSHASPSTARQRIADGRGAPRVAGLFVVAIDDLARCPFPCQLAVKGGGSTSPSIHFPIDLYGYRAISKRWPVLLNRMMLFVRLLQRAISLVHRTAFKFMERSL